MTRDYIPRPSPRKTKPAFFAETGSIIPLESMRIGVFILLNILGSIS